jgi:[acyl-carrier-protein] S-malonyltransferase
MHSVIGLADEQVEEACARARRETGRGVWPANYNCPGQLVISGEEAAAEAAAQICTAMGARRTIRLKVAGAFHTEMMQPAADRLAADLAAVELRQPRFPVVGNVTAEPVGGPDDIRDLLVRQVTSPVRWTGCMEWLLAQGIEQFCEVGPGRVLQGLLKRTAPAASCTVINGLSDAQAYAETLSNQCPPWRGRRHETP